MGKRGSDSVGSQATEGSRITGVSTDGRHSKWAHPSGAWVVVPDSHRTIHVSDIDGLTQARRISEIEEMARSLIAINTDTPLDDVAVHVTSITVPGVGVVAEKAAEITRLRAEARRLEAAAGQAASDYAKVMTREGVPVRDIAELLDVSPQRVSQIANSSSEK